MLPVWLELVRMLKIRQWSFYDEHHERVGQGDLMLTGHGRHCIPFSQEWPEDGREGESGGWWWDGDRENPTLKPSYRGGNVHISIEDGCIVHHDDCKCGCNDGS